jgi:hypothetical protein
MWIDSSYIHDCIDYHEINYDYHLVSNVRKFAAIRAASMSGKVCFMDWSWPIISHLIYYTESCPLLMMFISFCGPVSLLIMRPCRKHSSVPLTDHTFNSEVTRGRFHAFLPQTGSAIWLASPVHATQAKLR